MHTIEKGKLYIYKLRMNGQSKFLKNALDLKTVGYIQ